MKRAIVRVGQWEDFLIIWYRIAMVFRTLADIICKCFADERYLTFLTEIDLRNRTLLTGRWKINTWAGVVSGLFVRITRTRRILYQCL